MHEASALSQNSPRALAGTGIEEVKPELRAELVSWFETSPRFFNDSEVLAATLPWCKTIKIWASSKVKRVADGLTDKRSERAKKILPAGALLWAWEADRDYNEAAGEQWLVLLPEKWNRHVQYPVRMAV